MSERFEVGAAQAGVRLDRFLAEAQPELSRSRLRALIDDGRVRVNGRAARASLKLKAGDDVELERPPARATTIEPEPIALRIVYEDDDLAIVDKPAGLVVHPGAGVTSGTLVHGLLHRDPAIADVGGEGRPGLVHRLDRDTSGLLVVARTVRAHRALVEALQRREVHRHYAALVWGDPREDSGVVETAIGRDPRDRKRMAVVERGGKEARTRWAVRERFGIAALLDVELDTGRTHQIRVHCAYLRHPVVGDPVYGGRKKDLSPNPAQRSLATALLSTLDRQALHARKLEFDHPVTGRRLVFESPLPDDFRNALDRLRSTRSPA